MARSDFVAKNIEIDDLLLDAINPRIRTAKSQEECIAKVIRKEVQIFNMMKSIAEDGLTTMPVVVMPVKNKENKWVVKDGNRRVTAIKLLNDPTKCPDLRLQKRIQDLREKHFDTIPVTIECLSSDNEHAVVREVLARHSGAQDGVGQLDWSAYLSTIFAIGNDHPALYKNSGLYLFWAEQEGIDIKDEFPITNINRFFNKDNLKWLGFEISDNKLVLITSKTKAKSMAQRIIGDFGESRVKVSDIFVPEYAKNYLDQVRQEAGFMNDGDKVEVERFEDPDEVTDTKPKPAQPTGTRPTKPSWDRKKLFPNINSKPSIPPEHTKARDIVVTIGNVDVQKAPIAVAFLLRGLIEISTNRYIVEHRVLKKDSLAKNVSACADSMLSKALLSTQEVLAIKAIAQTDRTQVSLIAIESLQQMLHKDTHFPNAQTLNTMWDEIGCYIRGCWQ